MGYIEGIDRNQVTLFPQSLDEYITEDNPVRFIDAFVDHLGLGDLDFQRAIPNETGRPPYDPVDLLKLYIYGYLNRVRTSRRLERESRCNVEVMWLIRRLTPDFKTIADFRKDNGQALRGVCREFTLVCRRLTLFGAKLIAIDGSKFRGVNSRDRNYSQAKLKRMIKEIDKGIEDYFKELDRNDTEEMGDAPLTKKELRQKIDQLRKRKRRYKKLEKTLAATGATQVSLTDPDTRAMTAGHAQGMSVGYNVQTAVDAKHKLIIAHDVTNAVTDREQLFPMAKRAKDTLAVKRLTVTADMGYYYGAEVKRCLEHHITPYIPKPNTSANRKLNLFGKEDFRYHPRKDCYTCPAGATLTYRFTTVELGRTIKYYTTPACRGCQLKSRCTRNKAGRRLTRWVDEAILDAMARRVKRHPDKVKQRKVLAEHPFGTIKRCMDQGYFLMKGLTNVRTEMSLTILAYNMKRAINILGVERLMAAVG